MTEYTHGIPGEILRSRHHSPNGGISAHVDRVTVVGPNVPKIQRVTDDAPAVVIAQTTPGYVVLRPAAAPGEGRTSYMASGAYVAPYGFTEDWCDLFGDSRPYPLHDRTKTWAQYEAMST